MSMYRTPVSDTKRKPVETFELDDTNIVLYDYYHSEFSDNILFATVDADFVVNHTDKYAFGLTVAGTDMLYLDDELVVDNYETQGRGESFFGSGSVEEIGYKDLESGRAYRLRVEFGSATTSNLNKAGTPVFGAGGLRIGYRRCADESLDLDRAVEVAKTVDQVALCVGLGPEWESEGSDRSSYELPGRQSELISRICAVNADVVVVIQSGTPVSGPWEQVPAIMQAPSSAALGI